MLRNIVLENFKSFARAETHLGPFTLLVGANGSGKSNFIDALRFLHGLGQGWPIRDVVGGRVEGGTKLWSGIRGSKGEIVRAGADRLRISSTWHAFDGHRHTVETNGASIFREELDNLFKASRASGGVAGRDLTVEWLPGSMRPRDPQTGEMPVVHVSAESSALASPEIGGPFVTDFTVTLRTMRFLDLQPQAMRNYSEKRIDAPLADDGHNLSSVLWSLAQDPKRREELVAWLVELCSPEIADIDFDETQSDDVMLHVVERNGVRVTAKSLSDGTLRFLGVLAALKTLPQLQTLVIEDLDHGLHPSRLRLLVEAIAATTQWKGDKEPQVIATTHSPTLLDAALDEKASSVLLFARPDNGSIIRDVRTLPDLDEVRKRRDLAYLLNTGWMERAL